MFFGSLPLDECEGAILAHGVGTLKKGTALQKHHLVNLPVTHLSVAKLEAGDVGENEAAEFIAAQITGQGVRAQKAHTGRVNLFATQDGLLVFDKSKAHALNEIDESITLATLPAFRPVKKGEMLATIKIIPYGLPRELLSQISASPFEVKQFTRKNIALIQTTRAGLLPKVLDKTQKVTKARLAEFGASITQSLRVEHDTDALKHAIATLNPYDLLIIFGASAIADRGDVIPLALTNAGGEVHQLGMPVDPGNLIMLGKLAGIPVIGAPSCARSSSENGFDWVLHRLLAGLEVTPKDIRRMGVGGLISEIETRPQPRAYPLIAGLILAAGLGTRMQAQSKMLVELKGKPLLSHVVENAQNSALATLTVVTGHEAELVKNTLSQNIKTAHNHDYKQGLASSIACGITALEEADAALILLGDMPLISTATINALIEKYSNPQDIIVPRFKGQIGNPIVWGKAYFAALKTLEGDKGAKILLSRYNNFVQYVEIESDEILRDFDEKKDLERL